ncbi:hypothetical protein RSOLAG22IIIB_09260 [Rhizoctonia solani]|uniref:Interferon-induced 6-16 family n=1 Tax=Rhizoctonia solani TaxID=456999 RepID=A0A0K6FYC8_9AGAM|nr:hypothetical protein RSOLAG22IIIB_09260 [Rhizoctonia solani]
MGWDWDWDWGRFKRTLITAAKYAAVGAAITTTVVWIAPPLLGFTASGVAANSIAAAIQSIYYGGFVPAGSLFAILQSIGATGTLVPALVAGLGAGAFCGVSRIVVEALACAYKAAAAHIKKKLMDILKKLVIVGALAALDLNYIAGGQGGAIEA